MNSISVCGECGEANQREVWNSEDVNVSGQIVGDV